MPDDGQVTNPRAGKPESALLERLRKKNQGELLLLIQQILITEA